MGVRIGAFAPVLGAFVKPPRPADEEDSGSSLFERRRYPSPELEIGVLAAFKIAGIIFVPLSLIATLFGIYLQGFRADLRLDMQKVVADALTRHEDIERMNYAGLGTVTALHEELDRLRREHDDLEKIVTHNTGIIQRLVQKNGLSK